MTRLFVALVVTLCASKTLQNIPHQQFVDKPGKKSIVNTSSKSEPEKSPVLNIESKIQNGNTNVYKKDVIVATGYVEQDNKSNSYIPSIEPGADLRLISVISFIALSCLLCICFKMYR